MSEKLGTGIGGVSTESESTRFSFGTLRDSLLEEARVTAAEAAAEEALAEAQEGEDAAIAAVGAAAALGGALALALPLAFDIDVPEIALPTISGSDAVTEGDEETIETFDAIKKSADEQASMGDAVFQTLDPILNGVPVGEDGGVYAAADIAIESAGIPDDPTVPPIPFDGTSVVPSIARMQLFDEIAYAFRRSGMAAGATDPEAPGKILAAYITLAVEKFVRRAIIKVSLPDDAYLELLSKLTTFGSSTAAVVSGASSMATLSDYASPQKPAVYALDIADMMLGVDVVPLLNFYGGIKRLNDYGDNFDHEGYREDGAEAKMVNLQSILKLLENGINFI